MINSEFNFIDEAISALKDGYREEAVKIISHNSHLNLEEARVFISLVYQMGEVKNE